MRVDNYARCYDCTRGNKYSKYSNDDFIRLRKQNRVEGGAVENILVLGGKKDPLSVNSF